MPYKIYRDNRLDAYYSVFKLIKIDDSTMEISGLELGTATCFSKPETHNTLLVQHWIEICKSYIEDITEEWETKQDIKEVFK